MKSSHPVRQQKHSSEKTRFNSVSQHDSECYLSPSCRPCISALSHRGERLREGLPTCRALHSDLLCRCLPRPHQRRLPRGSISGWIMDSFDQVADMRGWQWMFIIESIPAVILGSLVLFFLDNGIREAKWLTEEEKLVLERNIESDAGGKKKSPHSLGGVLKDHRVWTMSAIYFCFVMG